MKVCFFLVLIIKMGSFFNYLFFIIYFLSFSFVVFFVFHFHFTSL